MLESLQVPLAVRIVRKRDLLSQEILAIFAPIMESENPAVRLVDGLGGRAATADRFSVSIEAVRLWLKNGIPADRALDIEDATHGTPFAISATEILEYRAQRAAA